MAIHWDEFEILRALDEGERGNSSRIYDGAELMRTIATQREEATTAEDHKSFLREMFALGRGNLVTWELTKIPPTVPPFNPHEAHHYLQNMHNPTLTIPGRDRACGRIVERPWPEPGEDDGRLIRALTLNEIADIIGAAYSPVQVIQLFIDSDVSMERFSFEGVIVEGPPMVSHVLHELMAGVDGERRELRHFLGAWLDDQLHTGPSEDEREKLTRDLARQGWFVRDGRLVVGEPVHRTSAPDAANPAIAQLHPTVWEAASPQWKVKHLHDSVMAASRAVNSTLQDKLGRNDVSEVKLVQSGFSSRPPTTGEPRLRFPDIADQQTRDSVTAGVLQFGVGCFMATRNPIGHRPDDEREMTEQEALEQLAAWSLFARWIERAEVEAHA